MSAKVNGGGYRALCPACRSPMRIRSSREQTETFKTMYAQCTNVACSASFSGSLTWDYALSESGLDKPRVVLPLAPAIERMRALQESRPATNQLDLLNNAEG